MRRTWRYFRLWLRWQLLHDGTIYVWAIRAMLGCAVVIAVLEGQGVITPPFSGYEGTGVVILSGIAQLYILRRIRRRHDEADLGPDHGSGDARDGA